MTWVSQALRKQCLKTSINELTSKQLKISQEISELQRVASNLEDGILTANEIANTPSNYYGTQMDFVEFASQAAYESATTKADAYIQQLQTTGTTTGNQYQYAAGNTIQPAVIFNEIYKQELKELAKQKIEQIDAEEQELEQEKLTIESQLKAAEAEYQSISSSLDNSIQDSAIKLS